MKLTIYTHQEPGLEPWQDEKKDPNAENPLPILDCFFQVQAVSLKQQKTPLRMRIIFCPRHFRRLLLSSPETNSSPLKINGWKIKFPFGFRPIFRGEPAVSLWEGNSNSKPDLSLVGVKQYFTYASRPPTRRDRHDRWFQILYWWWFQIFFIFTPIWERFPIWLIFFKWVGSTTNQLFLFSPFLHPRNIGKSSNTWRTCAHIFLPSLGVTHLWALRGMARGFLGPVFCQSVFSGVTWKSAP